MTCERGSSQSTGELMINSISSTLAVEDGAMDARHSLAIIFQISLGFALEYVPLVWSLPFLQRGASMLDNSSIVDACPNHLLPSTVFACSYMISCEWLQTDCFPCEIMLLVGNYFAVINICLQYLNIEASRSDQFLCWKH